MKANPNKTLNHDADKCAPVSSGVISTQKPRAQQIGKIRILLTLLIATLNVSALPFIEGMLPMSLVEFSGKKWNPDGSFGVLLLTYDFKGNDGSPILSFKDFIFRKVNNKCLAARSDIDETNIEGKLINFRGKQALSASNYSEYSDYGHSFLLTDISDAKPKYRLEVTRFYKAKEAKTVWVYESGQPFLDAETSPCVGKFNYSN